MKVNFVCSTDGNGLWSREKKQVKVHKIDILFYHIDSEEGYTGELAAYFNKRSWQLSKHGLIYSDKLWIREFRKELKNLGFSDKAVHDLNYSEQGMQSDNYVSMDVGNAFMKEWDAKMGLDSASAP
jgi:hypothetical protein